LINTTLKNEIILPAGMKFHVSNALVHCGTVTSDPVISIGTTASGTDIVDGAALATGTNTLTIDSDYTSVTTNAGGGTISVEIVTDAGDSIVPPCTVTLIGYVFKAPNSLRQATGTTSAGTVTGYR